MSEKVKGFADPYPIIAGVFARMLAPPPKLLPSTWAAKELVVADGPYAGEMWNPRLTPYIGPIIDEYGADATHNIGVVRKSAQTGLSIGGVALVGYYICQAPCRIGYALPTIDAVQEFNREKLTPTIEQSKALRFRVYGQKSRDGDSSTKTSKRFPGGSLVLINANSAPDLRAKTLKIGIADEIDEWAPDLDGQGDPLELYKARFIAFHASGDYRLLALSTPTILGASRVDQMFRGGDQRYWHIVCPGCEAEIVFEFKQLRFNKTPPHNAYYEAQCCGTVIEHHQKASLVRAGRFIPTNEQGLYPSWHVDALSSLLTTWDKVAEAACAAEGNEEKQKTFANTWLGLPYEVRGDAPDWEMLMARREPYPEKQIPPRGLLLVCGVDVQHNGLWVEVVAYAENSESWCVWREFLDGDTTDPDGGAWTKLDELYDEHFPDAFGGNRQIDAMAVDAGDGGRSQQVYTWVRGRARAYAIKGAQGWASPAIGTPSMVDINFRGKKIRRGAKLWPVGTWSLKSTWYGDLHKKGLKAGAPEDPPGYCHFGDWLDERYFRQITAEYLATEKIKTTGFYRRVWKQSYESNHLLDCRIYAMAMAEHLGLSRLTPRQWERLARKRGVPEKIEQAVEQSKRGEAKPKQRKRRSLADLARQLNG